MNKDINCGAPIGAHDGTDRYFTPEIEAMKRIVEALEPLTDDERRRVLWWAADRYLDIKLWKLV
jgi:hypothetical protein